MNKIPIVDWKLTVLNATIIGLFRSTGRRVEICKHVSCGYLTPTDRKCYVYPGNPHPVPDPKDYYYTSKQHQYNDQQGHISAGCKNKWCVKRHGPFKDIVDQKVVCKRTYFKPYTEQELANPETKAELMAINMDVASDSYHGNYHNLVVIYDLMNDRWFSDDWWSETQAGNLAPAQNPIEGVKPNSVHGIDDVIKRAKELL